MSPSPVDPKLRELARQLGLDSRGDCVTRLREHALSQVIGPVEALGVNSSQTLLDVVAGLQSVKVLFIEADEDIPRLGEEYERDWPELVGQLRHEFLDRDTMGLVVAHPNPLAEAHRYLAFIDSRGDRAVRAYFTAWHEIAHLLLQPSQLSFSGFRRVTTNLLTAKDPLEALVDQVAGELAFFGPLVRPTLDDELRRTGRLTMNGIERVRTAVTPKASLSSCVHALTRMVESPTAFLVAGMKLKPSEARAMSSGQLTLIDPARPVERLRVISAFPNAAAKDAGFAIFPHMRVPPDSKVTRVFRGESDEEGVAAEDQKMWESGGRYLDPLSLRVEGRRLGDVVYALMNCSTV
ncbi:MAG: hypothetical protein RH859_08155 [Longimicrobiales bacterium]